MSRKIDDTKVLDQIQERLSDYLGFDIQKLSNFAPNDWYIFGGALRDSIAGQQINDIDIVSKPIATKKLFNLFTNNGFIQETSSKLTELYKGINLIFEPITLSKTVNNKKIYIQLIRPSHEYVNRWSKKVAAFEETAECTNRQLEDAYKYFTELADDVDIRCCALRYSVSDNILYETVPGAILDCNSKRIKVLDNARMQTDRIKERIQKLKNRGWQLGNFSEETMINLYG